MVATVSLAVPVYNGEQFLQAALTSILEQTYEDFEVIITDNASTDSTPEICRAAAKADVRIRYVRLAENIGAGPNFNHAFELSAGRYFKWCAHDDLISPNFLERCVETLSERSDAALAFGRTECINNQGKQIAWDESNFMPAIEDDDPVARMSKAIRGSGTCFPVFGLFRTDVLRRSTLHRPYYGSDRALLVEAAMLGKLVLVDDAIFYNRHHERRSIEIDDHAARAHWHNASEKRWRTPESISYLKHLTEIALRHGDTVKRVPAFAEAVKYGLAPQRLGQHTLGMARMISPAVAEKLKATWNRLIGPGGSQAHALPDQRMKNFENEDQ